MSHLKQILHNSYTKILKIISTSKTDLKSLGLVPQNFLLAENLGKLLLSLKWLVIIIVYMAVLCILSLWLLIDKISTRLGEQLKNIVQKESNVRSILCRWVDAVKNIILMLKKWLTSVWKKDGDSLQGYTFPYLGMPGEHKQKDESKDKLDRLRKSGL